MVVAKSLARMAPALALGLALGATAAGAATHVVDQSNLAFAPADLTVQVGDVVQWVWHSGAHTVTSGAGLGDPALGALFDAPLDPAAPTFSFTFTTAGDVPYLCRPHASLGMTGIVRVVAPTGVEGGSPISTPLLRQNAPNPFNPLTVISFVLPDAGTDRIVSLRVFDLKGRWVTTLVEAPLPSGSHAFTWDGRFASGAEAPSGAYVYRLAAAGSLQTKTMVLLR